METGFPEKTNAHTEVCQGKVETGFPEETNGDLDTALTEDIFDDVRPFSSRSRGYGPNWHSRL